MEVEDESVFIDSSAQGTWNTQDGCELYLDIRHGRETSSAVQHFIYGDQAPSDSQEPAIQTAANGSETGTVNAVAIDGTGTLWLGGESGLTRWGSDGRQRFTRDDGLPHNGIRALEADGDVLWIGTWAGGLSRYDGKSFKNFTVEDGLPHNQINALLRDRSDGALWIGTWAGGLSRYDGKSFKNFTVEKDDLVHNTVRALAADPRGVLWVGTDGGLSRYDGFAFQSLLLRDGLASSSVKSLLVDGTGAWIGGDSGLTRFSPRTSPPTAQITDAITDRHLDTSQGVRLSSAQPQLSFTFAGLSFKTRPTGIAFRYRLRGLEDD